MQKLYIYLSHLSHTTTKGVEKGLFMPLFFMQKLYIYLSHLSHTTTKGVEKGLFMPRK